MVGLQPPMPSKLAYMPMLMTNSQFDAGWLCGRADLPAVLLPRADTAWLPAMPCVPPCRERRLSKLPDAHMYVGRTPLTLQDIRAWNTLQEQGCMVSWPPSKQALACWCKGGSRRSFSPILRTGCHGLACPLPPACMRPARAERSRPAESCWAVLLCQVFAPQLAPGPPGPPACLLY